MKSDFAAIALVIAFTTTATTSGKNSPASSKVHPDFNRTCTRSPHCNFIPNNSSEIVWLLCEFHTCICDRNIYIAYAKSWGLRWDGKSCTIGRNGPCGESDGLTIGCQDGLTCSPKVNKCVSRSSSSVAFAGSSPGLLEPSTYKGLNPKIKLTTTIPPPTDPTTEIPGVTVFQFQDTIAEHIENDAPMEPEFHRMTTIEVDSPSVTIPAKFKVQVSQIATTPTTTTTTITNERIFPAATAAPTTNRSHNRIKFGKTFSRSCERSTDCQFLPREWSGRIWMTCKNNNCTCSKFSNFADVTEWEVSWDGSECRMGLGGPCGEDDGLKIGCGDGHFCLEHRCRAVPNSVGQGQICGEDMDCQVGLLCKTVGFHLVPVKHCTAVELTKEN